MVAQQLVSFKSFAPTQARLQPARSSRGVAVVRCDFAAGAKVKVTAPIKVFHVGKFKQGLDLQGMEGTITADARQHKGMELSATLPWKVQFEAKDGEGKPVKVIAHFVSVTTYIFPFIFLLLVIYFSKYSF